MNVLVACEESQAVAMAFREQGHDAYSNDLKPCSGNHPEFHIQGDVLAIINGRTTFQTQDGKFHKIKTNWDMIIAHPPCTYLTVTGNRWFDVERYGEKALIRYSYLDSAKDFFMAFTKADCPHICIENPVGVMSSFYRPPDQIIQPYFFGDAAEKRTCLWLIGLDPLKPTDIVTVPERVLLPSGKTMGSWYYETSCLSHDIRAEVRSKTFPGIAQAMAKQWGSVPQAQITLF